MRLTLLRLLLLYVICALALALTLVAEAHAYLPGEGGSYYTWQDTGQPCAPFATWHKWIYWSIFGPIDTGERACF